MDLGTLVQFDGAASWLSENLTAFYFESSNPSPTREDSESVQKIAPEAENARLHKF